MERDDRDRQVVRTSVVGIATNVLLAVFKAVAGILSGSIAITLDAVNNLSDAASSVITIVGTKLAGKPADRRHPFGYGRVEYLTAMVISVIVLYAGIASLEESVRKILHPEPVSYSALSLGIVAVGVLAKILLGRYVTRVGRRVHSDSLEGSGKDALLDSVISATTLLAAVAFLLWGVSLESWLGAVISLVIIKSGIAMLAETLSEILGERADKDLAKKIKAVVKGFSGVSGVYDLVLNNYGPDTYNGSLHIEVPDTMTAEAIDLLTREISLAVYRQCGVALTAISIYALNTKDPEVVEIRDKVWKLVSADPNILQMHGFFLSRDPKKIRFDLVVGFDARDRAETLRNVLDKVRQAYPSYEVEATLDTDFAES